MTQCERSKTNSSCENLVRRATGGRFNLKLFAEVIGNWSSIKIDHDFLGVQIDRPNKADIAIETSLS